MRKSVRFAGSQRWQLIAVLAFALVVAACDAEPPSFDPDWCWEYDLETNDQGFLGSGEWTEGVGLSFDEDENFFYKQELFNVAPQYIKVNAFVAMPFGGTIDVDGFVFGVVINESPYFPPGFSGDVVLSAEPIFATATDEIQVDIAGPIANGGVVILKSLEVAGIGISLYPTSNCGYSPTATPSPSPTNTQTPTPTFTPTNTPEPITGPDNFVCIWDFIVDRHWDNYRAQYVAGSGWRRDNNLTNRFDIDNNDLVLSGEINYYEIRYSIPFTTNADGGNFGGSIYIYPPGAAVPATTILSPFSYTANFNGNLVFRHSNHQTPGTASAYPSSLYLQYLEIRGYGSHSGDDNCYYTGTPTPTPAPTSTTTLTPSLTPTITQTPVPTFTPTNFEVCKNPNYSFDLEPNTSLGGWIGSEINPPAQVWQPGLINLNGSMTAGTGGYLYSFQYMDDGFYDLIVEYEVTSHGVLDNDGTILFTNTYNFEQSSEATLLTESSILPGINTLTMEDLEFTDPTSNTILLEILLTNITTIRLHSVCLIKAGDLPGSDNPPGDGDDTSWRECENAIPMPTNFLDIGGWLQYLWRSLEKFLTCFLVPLIWGIINAIEGVVGWLIGAFSSIFQWLGGIVEWLVATLGNVLAAIVDLLGWLINTLGGIINAIIGIFQIVFEVFALLLNIAGQIIALLVSWIQQLGEYAAEIMALWTNATPIKPDGIPDCVAAPLESDLCAIWYVAKWTLLSGNVGALLIPSILFIFDAAFVLFVLIRVKRLIIGLREEVAN